MLYTEKEFEALLQEIHNGFAKMEAIIDGDKKQIVIKQGKKMTTVVIDDKYNAIIKKGGYVNTNRNHGKLRKTGHFVTERFERLNQYIKEAGNAKNGYLEKDVYIETINYNPRDIVNAICDHTLTKKEFKTEADLKTFFHWERVYKQKGGKQYDGKNLCSNLWKYNSIRN